MLFQRPVNGFSEFLIPIIVNIVPSIQIAAYLKLNRSILPGLFCPGYFIEKSEDVGDLMGAIHGIKFTGFIGETYTRYPFPSDPAGFRQKPEGCRTRKEFREIILKYAVSLDISTTADHGADSIFIGDYGFGRPVFNDLLDYVWQGGYPRWRDGERPDYLLDLRHLIRSGY